MRSGVLLHRPARKRLCLCRIRGSAVALALVLGELVLYRARHLGLAVWHLRLSETLCLLLHLQPL